MMTGERGIKESYLKTLTSTWSLENVVLRKATYLIAEMHGCCARGAGHSARRIAL
jgi:hypothetical protein